MNGLTKEELKKIHTRYLLSYTIHKLEEDLYDLKYGFFSFMRKNPIQKVEKKIKNFSAQLAAI